MVTQLEIARRVSLDVSSVNKILNKRQGPVFRKETVKKVFKIARDLGYDFGRLKFTHRRRHGRSDVALGAEFFVFGRDGALYDQGVATIRDLSMTGARVTDIALPQGNIPTEPFTVAIKPMQKPLDDCEFVGKVVRMLSNDTLSYGVEFTKMDPQVLKKLRKLVR